MKFGDTLRERSIPQWAYHNIDYDDLKQMVKDHTVSAPSHPLFIPGQGGEAKAIKDFEDEMYGQLLQQHDRVGLFVQSKAGELARKLAALEKTMEKLEQRFAPVGTAKSSVRRIERFSRLEDYALNIGRELGFLERFVQVNSQGFRKILKKYKKWTGSSGLEKRFRNVLDRPTSFTKRNFSMSLAHYDLVLANIRHAIRKAPRSLETCCQQDTSARSTPTSGSTRPTSVSTSSGQKNANGRLSPRLQSSETSAPDMSESSPTINMGQKRRIRRKRPLNRAVHKAPPTPEQRYWNEFDDGDDNTDNETYTIYVDPDTPNAFPGASTLSPVVGLATVCYQKMKSWLWREKSMDSERQSLLENERASSRSSSDASDIENGRPGPISMQHVYHGRSPTMLRRYLGPSGNTREVWLAWASIGAFLVAYVLLFLVIILVTTGRRKAVATTDIGALVGVAFSLVFGLGGLGACRRGGPSWIWWIVTSCLFVLLVVGNGVILVRVL